MEISLIEMGNRIATRRKHMGIKQSQLAEKINITSKHLSNIECGRERPSFEVLICLCNELKVTPDYLLMGSMHPQGIPQNLIDSLSLCTKEDIALVEDIIRHMVLRQEKKWNDDNFV